MSANTLLTSVVTGGSNSHATVAEEANTYATDFVSNGVVGTFTANVGSGGTGSFCVNADASPDMGVTIKAGQAYVTATPSGQNSQTLRVRAAADYTAYTINANASGSTKYDWVYLTISATNANTPSSDASNVASFTTSRSSSNTTDNGSPPTYGYLLAIVTVANAASSITNSNILDKRAQAAVSTAGTSSTTGWTTGLTVPTTVAANGNRSYTLTVNGTDLTGTVSAGMRLRTTRLVAAPTQCTSLNGTTQYYSKTSPAGVTFTTTFTVMGWVKLTSYGAVNYIASRFSSSGWGLRVLASGQVEMFGSGSGTTDLVTSYQSIPLNKWVHVAVSMNMGTSAGAVYIDGALVPSLYTDAATTALVQAGDLTVGALTGGSLFFNGKLAQVAIFSAVISQATIQSYISQGLAGTETSLVSAYSFNNAITDLNANANNLTANGSALATNADSPFGGQAGGTISSTLDYGIITSASFSTNTTLVVQVPEGCTIPTSGGVSAVSYSTVGVPYGFPRQTGKWRISSILKTDSATTSNATYGAFSSGGWSLNVPIGEWRFGWEAPYYNGSTTEVTYNVSSTALTGLTQAQGANSSRYAAGILSPSAASTLAYANTSNNESLAAATSFIMYTLGATTSSSILGTRANAEIYAECAHL